MSDLKMPAIRAMGMALGLVLLPALSEPALGQVKTTVPDVVAGARPARVERITIHGKGLDGNLEGNAVDRTVLVILPPDLRQYRAIAIDVGDMDNLKTGATKLHDVFTSYGITHDFEIYSGTHTSHVAVRFQENVMPFFGKTLSFETARR